jgi:hypothetical protein
MDHIAFTKISRVNIKTRDNDLIEDKKMKDVISDYKDSVYIEVDAVEDLPDHFYYLMCSTNNNT